MLLAVGSPDMLRVLLKHGGNAAKEEPAGHPLLNQFASWGTYPDVIRLLVQNGADPERLDANGLTPLGEAALYGHADAVRVLLELGAKPNTPNTGGLTALHMTAMYGHSEAAAVLLSRGADVNARNEHGLTPLDYALQEYKPSCSQVAEVLRQHGGVQGRPSGAEVR